MSVPIAPCAVKKFLGSISEMKKEEGSVMAALHEAQNIFGYIPMDICEMISKQFNVPMSTISGIVSFYSRFTLTPPGEIRIDVCQGTACFVKGAGKIYEKIKSDLQIGEDGLSPNKKFSLSTARCFGCCSLAPVITIDDEAIGNIKLEDLDKILSDLKQRSKV